MRGERTERWCYEAGVHRVTCYAGRGQLTAEGGQYPGWMKMEFEKGIVTVSTEVAKNIFYNDTSSEESDKWAAKFQPQSLGVYTFTTTYAAWRDIPSTYVIGSENRTFFGPEPVDAMIEAAKEIQPSAFDIVERCEGTGHSLMIGRPGWLAGVLRRAAGETC